MYARFQKSPLYKLVLVLVHAHTKVQKNNAKMITQTHITHIYIDIVQYEIFHRRIILSNYRDRRRRKCVNLMKLFKNISINFCNAESESDTTTE